MSLNLSEEERALASAYRAMRRQTRLRLKRLVPARAPAARAREISKTHKAAVSKLFCVATATRFGLETFGVQVAHLRFSNAAFGALNPGIQRKPDDRWVLPLSPEEHRLQHSMGEAAYWAELQIDPHALAAELWGVSGDLTTMLSAERLVVASAQGRLSKPAGVDGAQQERAVRRPRVGSAPAEYDC